MAFASLVKASLLMATACLGADELPQATRVIEESKATFPAESIPAGVEALAAALASCHDLSDRTVTYTADDLKKAQEGDHVRFLFPQPLKVEIVGKDLEVSEAVFADGVFWLVTGQDVLRCTKYTRDKFDRFREWFRQPLPAD